MLKQIKQIQAQLNNSLTTSQLNQILDMLKVDKVKMTNEIEWTSSDELRTCATNVYDYLDFCLFNYHMHYSIPELKQSLRALELKLSEFEKE